MGAISNLQSRYDDGDLSDILDRFRAEFPRFFDLYERSDRLHPDNYFHRFLEDFGGELWRKAFEPAEAILQRLEPQAWESLAIKALPFVTKKSAIRGHNQLFDHLDEGRGYALLADRGYETIHFIDTGNARSPDLAGSRHGTTTILEVKSINRSQKDLIRLATPEARDVAFGVSNFLKRKLTAAIGEAREQLEAYSIPVEHQILLLVVRLEFDYMFVRENYMAVGDFTSSFSVPGFEVLAQQAL